MMYADGDMMGSDEEGMDHDMMGDSYGMEGSHGYDVSALSISHILILMLFRETKKM